VERLAATGAGRVEVSGRWFGVRGRRFVRPTLTLTMGDDGPQRRWLAELEHKPWAAQDGEPWIAAFPVDVELADASAVELAVAPDIEITLRAPAGATGSAAESPVAAHARSPVAKQEVDRRRPSARAQDLERMTTRLSAAQAALERERERRAAAEQALDEQRAEGRRLIAELGRTRAESELVRTVQRESEAMSAELDAARAELRAAEHRYEQLVAEHSRAVDEHTRLETELRERSGALESARDALEQERARRSAPRRTAPDHLPIRLEPPAPAPPAFEDAAPSRPVAPHRIERPVNPALKPRPNWAGRVLALLVIIAVIIAVWLVLHSTILH
jgi:hypothetical protein